DLIHWQYFKKNKRVHNFMLLVGWILRPGTINPWVRRHLHFLHHKTSGTSQDMEERGIGNGANYGPLRFLVMMDTFLCNILRVTLFAPKGPRWGTVKRSEEHTSELQSREKLVCRLLLEKKNR